MSGICRCGCGGKTEIAPETRPQRGWKLGKPKPYLDHHGKIKHASRDGVYKICSKCKEKKYLNLFHKEIGTYDGRQARCKKCQAENTVLYREARLRGSKSYSLRSAYGLTTSDYESIHAQQNGLCAICNKPETAIRLKTPRRLAVDHCHTTDKVRGLLCAACNRGLACFRDNPDFLEAAARYLRKSRA
jgi:hypothetical protein